MKAMRYVLIAGAVVAGALPLHTQPLLNFRINDGLEISSAQGSPLVLTTIVIDEQAQMQLSYNAGTAIELEYLRQQLSSGKLTRQQYDERVASIDTAAVRSSTIGSQQNPWHGGIIWQMYVGDGKWTSASWVPVLLLVPPTEPAGVIDGVEVVAAAFGLDPDVTGSLAPKRYQLRSGLLPGVVEGVRDTLWSNSAVVNIEERQKRSSYEEQRWLAHYWLRRGQYQRAFDLTDQLIRQQPDYINLYEMLGDALVGLGRPDEAAAQYGRGIELYYAQQPEPYEPPDLLIDKLNALTKPPTPRR